MGLSSRRCAVSGSTGGRLTNSPQGPLFQCIIASRTTILKPMRIPTLIAFCLLCGAAAAQSDRKVTAAMVDRWMTELSNWGRWGKEDQLGTLNLITSAKRKQAAAL